ncbi:hypothetical protein [Planococcus shixiaomingii]|uniref:hypothetical protein n=1 Tax=Planococcus shixiaomingii TaxID=3058393 RepID=UPI002630C60D|nr:hypothetical protein [Planococcus sp. N022]WKA56220.1 hypothetical protein QWY21_07725 [Planococcus sp. N022]
MTIKPLIAILSLAILLAGCGMSEDTKEEVDIIEEPASELETTDEELVSETDFSTAAPGEWLKAASGDFKLTSYGYNEDIGLDFSESPYIPVEAGPMGVTVKTMTVIDYRPGEGQKRVVFGGKDEVRIVSAFIAIDNYSDKEISFDPDEATLITNNGETVKPLKYWTWTIDGNFPAGASKAVDVAWALEDMDSELSSVRIVMEPPVSKESNKALSEPLEIEIEILPY